MKKSSAQGLVEAIIVKTGAKTVPNTVDVIKEGDPRTKITGIATCMFATMDVLQKAIQMDCNLVIAHEPLYYNHWDSNEEFQKDSVYLEKRRFIEANGLVVWRFHDYIHRIRPDGILTGMIKKLDWEENLETENSYTFTFPEITLQVLLDDLKDTFPKSAFQVVGDPQMKLNKVALLPGSWGSLAQIAQLRKKDIQVVIAGEVPEWETYEYVRDAISQGRKKAIVFIGHINSEEYGMKFCADWLKEFIPDIPIHFVECGSSYWTY
ncbi:MAG: Nif3-like dinuclear metal center hexameric protein [Bacteroidota bacterium]